MVLSLKEVLVSACEIGAFSALEVVEEPCVLVSIEIQFVVICVLVVTDIMVGVSVFRIIRARQDRSRSFQDP